MARDYCLFDSVSIKEATQGTIVVHSDLYAKNDFHTKLHGVYEVIIDSRKAAPGTLFVPIRGEHVDGHSYIPEAIAKGSSACLVERSYYETHKAQLNETLVKYPNSFLVIVENSLYALQALGAYHVRRFPNLIRIGVTGSSGKTTCKEMLVSILSREKRVICNQGNLNSDSGLPLSVLSIRPEHEVGVFEMGMNRTGEIKELANILFPQFALITNIGTAHIGILGSKDAIALEKKQIFSNFTGTEHGYVPEAEPYLDFLQESVNGTVRAYGVKSDSGFTGSENLGLDGTRINWEGLEIKLPVPGSFNISNALGAIAIARDLGISKTAIKSGLESLPGLFGRNEVIRCEYTILKDCYNANPESMRASIESADLFTLQGRKIYVLGSMFELGEDSFLSHREVGDLVSKSKADAIFFFGSEMLAAYERAEELLVPFYIEHALTIEELAKKVSSYIQKGDFILLKASRGMQLERLIPYIDKEERKDSHVS